MKDCPHVEPGGTCPTCGYHRKVIPPWCQTKFYRGHDKTFGLRGRRWRIVSLGGTNDVCGGSHYRDYVAVIPVEEEQVEFPPDGSSVQALVGVLDRVFGAQQFSPDDLERAIYSEEVLA